MNLRVFYLTRRGISDGYESFAAAHKNSFNITLKEREDVSQMGDILSFVFRFVLFE